MWEGGHRQRTQVQRCLRSMAALARRPWPGPRQFQKPRTLAAVMFGSWEIQASARCTAGRSSMRWVCANTFGNEAMSTPSLFSQVPMVNR